MSDVPQAAEEEAAICSALIGPGSATLVDAVRERLRPEHFQDPGLAERYRSILNVRDRDMAPDKTIVWRDLCSRGVDKIAGRPEDLVIDFSVSNDPVVVGCYVDEILNASEKREFLRFARSVAVGARNGKSSSDVRDEIRTFADQMVKADDGRIIWVEQEEIFARGVSPTSWDVERILERSSGPAILFGEPGSYKSWIALHLSACMVTGEPAFGHFRVFPRPRSMYCNRDSGAKPFDRRVALLGRPVPGLVIASPDEFDIDAFAAALAANPGAWVVVDSFSDMYQPDPKIEQGAEMRRFLRPLRALFEKHGCGGLLIDHTNRSGLATSERYYGSVQKKAAIRQMIAIERVRMPEAQYGKARVKLSCAKMSEDEQFAPFLVDLEWTDTTFHAQYAGEADEAMNRASQTVTDAEQIAAVLVKAADSGLTRSEIEEQTELPRERVRLALKAGGFNAIGAEKSPRRRYVVRTPLVALDFEDGDA